MKMTTRQRRRTRPRRGPVALLAVTVLAAGCSELDDLEAWVRGLLGGEEEIVAAEPEPEPEPADEEPEPDPEPEPEPVEEEPEPDLADGPPAFELDLPGIELLTPFSGEGQRPVLEWASVDGADSYLVVLRADPDAPATWLWRGMDTEIRVGFVETPGIGGPEVREGMVWSVLAFDDEDVPVAQSGQRPIGP